MRVREAPPAARGEVRGAGYHPSPPNAINTARVAVIRGHQSTTGVVRNVRGIVNVGCTVG